MTASSERNAFDVRAWVANLVGCEEFLVAETTYNEDDSFTATYRCGPQVVATVAMRGLTLASARSASWELIAELQDRTERAILPANARFVW